MPLVSGSVKIMLAMAAASLFTLVEAWSDHFNNPFWVCLTVPLQSRYIDNKAFFAVRWLL